MTLTLNPECGRAAMRRICASLPRQRTAAGDTPGRPIVRISLFCHILPFIFLSLIAFFDNLNEYKKRMNDNNKQPNSHGGDNMDFRPIRTRLVASSPSFLLSFHSAATTLVKAFRCVCVLHRVADAVSRHCLSRRANLALCSKKEKVQLQHFNISIMMGRPSVSQKHSSIPSIISEYIAPSHRETTSAKDNYSVCAAQFPLFFPFLLFAILLITVGALFGEKRK
jgi:hypothetical protein